MNQLPKPDIKYPVDDPHELGNLIIREWSDRKAILSPEREASWDATREANQCYANVDGALDRWPLGVLRNDVVLDTIPGIAV